VNIVGKEIVGGFVGCNKSVINDAYVMFANIYSNGINVGGFVGDNIAGIDKCFATETNIIINNTATSATGGVGAFAGINNSSSTISNSYVTLSKITMNSAPTGVSAGGFVGSNSGTNTNCYTAAATTAGTGGTRKLFTNSGTNTNCYYIGSSTDDGIDGTTARTYRQSVTATELNSTDFATQPPTTTYSYNDKYPIITEIQKNGENYVYETMVAIDYEDPLIIDGTTITAPQSPIVIEDGKQVINNTTTDIDAYVKKTLQVGKWNLIGSEVKDQSIIMLNGNYGTTSYNIHDMVLSQYNYGADNWNTDNNYGCVKEDMNGGEGYFVYPLTTAVGGTTSLGDNETLLTEYGTLYNDATTQITKTTTVANGWVSLANPYPANISISTFLTNNATNIKVIILYMSLMQVVICGKQTYQVVQHTHFKIMEHI
jgi:hypothetical protein